VSRLIQEYRSMSFQVHIAVVSNISRDLGQDVEVVVGLPAHNPWSLPFAHKKIFCDRVSDYDLFIYSEDDILITEKNLRSFVNVTAVLRADECAGFFIKEIAPDGSLHHCQAHGPFHWDVSSVRRRGEYALASFTNEHAACYVLTRKQLERCMATGRFLVPPHEGRYDMLCTAATDPYTVCGLQKLIPISHFEDFLVHHLPNKYIDRFGAPGAVLRRQINALMNVGPNSPMPALLFEPESKLPGAWYSKDYYEPARVDIAGFIPGDGKSVLSLGCGWGAMEALLVAKGCRVIAAPMDPVTCAGIEESGVELVTGDLKVVREKLAEREFDSILMSNMLHLLEYPVEVLAAFSAVLSPSGRMIAVVPNLARVPVTWRRIRRDPHYENIGNYERTRVHVPSRRKVRSWFKHAGLTLEYLVPVVPARLRPASRLSFGTMDALLSTEFIAVGRRH
jgi:2-polyprenyl-3-methyl-5-hydroxy-6-metoxy-1,4-benzoquinol methylase